tara:strand:- start:135 stop:320 length:186 start_codon:yes stop_codon:yes gene_type:complete
MQYELWEVISFGEGEPPMPFILADKSEDFSGIYVKFKNLSKKRPCVIFVNTKSDKTGDHNG